MAFPLVRVRGKCPDAARHSFPYHHHIPSDFNLSAFLVLASKPCDQSDVQQWCAIDAALEEGTSGLRLVDPVFAWQVVAPQA